MSSTTPSPDPRLAQALAAAERRLAMLERLAEMGMAIAGEIAGRAVDLPHRPEAGAGPARAFASVSRAVRLTLLLAAKVETHILATRKGELSFGPEAFGGEAAESPEARGERVRAAISIAIEREAADAEDGEMLRHRLHQRLAERDNFGAFLARPFRECVEAICEDLGLDAEAVLAGEDDVADLILSPEEACGSLSGIGFVIPGGGPGQGPGPESRDVARRVAYIALE